MIAILSARVILSVRVILSAAKDLLAFARLSKRSSRSLVALLLGMTLTAGAQSAPIDPVFARARQLVVNGNGAAGRLLIDSVITATPTDSPMYGEALYWRAALAATSADAEHDYRRLVVEYPFSPHAGEALLQLGQLESARGDRAAATTHLEQFLLDNPKSGERPRAVLLLVRLLMEQNDLPRGCTTLRQTLKDIPETSVELRNQLEYYLPRCTASDAGRGGSVPVNAPPAEPPRDSVKRDTVATPKASKGRFTLQVAAYKTKVEADALAKRLKARKFDARVVGTAKLFRVRVGRYPTRAAAAAAQKELKAKKIDAFVTEIGSDDER